MFLSEVKGECLSILPFALDMPVLVPLPTDLKEEHP